MWGVHQSNGVDVRMLQDYVRMLQDNVIDVRMLQDNVTDVRMLQDNVTDVRMLQDNVRMLQDKIMSLS